MFDSFNGQFDITFRVRSPNKLTSHDIADTILKVVIRKRQRKPKGQSRIYKPEALTTPGTKNTRRRQKHNRN